jgi:hypothetical protein
MQTNSEVAHDPNILTFIYGGLYAKCGAGMWSVTRLNNIIAMHDWLSVSGTAIG